MRDPVALLVQRSDRTGERRKLLQEAQLARNTSRGGERLVAPVLQGVGTKLRESVAATQRLRGIVGGRERGRGSFAVLGV